MLKTEAILNAIGFMAHQDPGPILVLRPRNADAKAFSRERVAPMIRDTADDPLTFGVVVAVFEISGGLSGICPVFVRLSFQ